MSSREQFEAWWEINYHNGNPPRFGWAAWRDGDGYKIDDDESELDAMWNAWQAATKAMEAKYAALAAENAALKATSDDRRMFIMNGVQLGYIKVPTVETDPALETIRFAVSPQETTTATDAFLAEVRAQGVEMVIAYHRERADALHHVDRNNAIRHSMAALDASDVAAQLRQEAQ